jgi:hypothetical protein
MTSKVVPPGRPWCSEKVPVFVWRNQRTLTFHKTNTWIRFNALPEGDEVKIWLSKP